MLGVNCFQATDRRRIVFITSSSVFLFAKVRRVMAEETTSTKDAAVEETVGDLGLETLKPKQREAILSFLSGRDTMVVLPTGYGKSIIYAALPWIFDKLRGTA